jgi:phage terminase Nu1 subunit (DNA packaging protein)
MAKKSTNSGHLQTGHLVTVAEFAKHRGVSHGSVVAALRNKTIAYANATERLIDRELASELMDAANARAGKINTTGDDGSDLASTSARLNVARADREEAQAVIAQLKAAQMRGELIAVADLAPVLYSLARVLRERLMSSAQRLGPILAAEPRAVRCTLAIEREVGAALTEFAEGIPTALASVAKQTTAAAETGE